MRARLSGLDELFAHRVPLSHCSIGTSDRNWRARMWFSDRRHRDGTAYKGYDGWFQGHDWGGSHFIHDVWDFSDPAVVDRTNVGPGGCDRLFEAHIGGQVIYGLYEYAVTPGYGTYSDLQAVFTSPHISRKRSVSR